MGKEDKYFNSANTTKIFNHLVGAFALFFSIEQHFVMGAICGTLLCLGRAGIDLARDYFRGRTDLAMPEK